MDTGDIPTHVVEFALEKGADDVICTVGSGNKKQVRFANSEISVSKSWDYESASIFIAKDKKIVEANINDFKTLDRSIEDLLSLAKVMKKSQNYHGIADGTFPYREKKFDKRIVDIAEDLVDYASKGIDSALEAGAKRVAGVLYSSCENIYQASSGGAVGDYHEANIEISLRAFTSKEASGHSVQSVTDLNSFAPEKVGEEAGRTAKAAQHPRLGDEGKFDVLFSPLVFANFLARVASSASAGTVDAGLSFLKDLVGKRVGNDNVNLHDDSTQEVIGSPPFDNEGVPTRKTTFIEDGVLRTYLHNTSTAKKYGVETTGNSGLIFPTPWNCHLDPGNYSMDEMLSEMKNGLYVTNTWYTRFQNYQTGDFSTIPRDAIFKVENGEITSAVKDIRISENMLNILKNMTMIGNDPRQIHWWEVRIPIITPHVVVKQVNITRSTQ